MFSRKLKFISRIAAFLLPILTLATTLAQEPPSNPSASTSLTRTRIISPEAQQAALKHWTRDAIASAKPMEMPAQFGQAAVDAAAAAAPQATGPVGSSPAGVSSANANRVAREAYPQDWAAISTGTDAAALDEPAGTSQVYTSYTANPNSALQTMYPHRWVGRLTFTTPSGTSFCSGTSISNNVMLTAAHCLYDTTNNRWYSNWVLTPAYRNGSAPYGSFAATQCWVLTAWVNLSGSFAINSWTQHDVGVCRMGNNSAGQTLNTAVGWMGRQWNFPYARHFHVVGYPFRDYNNNTLSSGAGAFLRACVSESFQQTTETRGTGCNWGGGISGGPWIVGYAPTVVTGAADGVNSGIFIGTQNMYGARFNSNNIVPLCNAATC
jgi:hypothetical protein